MIDNILSTTIRLLCACVLFSNINFQIHSTEIMCLDFRINRKQILLFFTDFKIFTFYNSIARIPKIVNKSNRLKTKSNYLPY